MENTTELRAAAVQEHVAGTKKMDSSSLTTTILTDLPTAMKELEALRAGGKDRKPVDLSLGQYVQDKWGFAPADVTGSPEAFYRNGLGMDPGQVTMQTLFTMPEVGGASKFLVPEIIREAIRLGLKRSPIYPSLTITNENVSQTQVTMPSINEPDAMPKKLNEAETIPVGSVSFGSKDVKISKVGIGMEVTDEVVQYVSLNLVALFFSGLGQKLGIAMDKTAIDTLLNGDQADGSDAVAVIGVKDTGVGFQYRDFLQAWIRLSRLGKLPSGMLGGEIAAMDILDLEEFRKREAGTTLKSIDLRTPIPQNQAFWIHGAMPDNQVMLVDNSSALIQLTARALSVESDRIVQKQINGTYATMTTGFATAFRDARLVIDATLPFATNGFPAWMDPTALERQGFKI